MRSSLFLTFPGPISAFKSYFVVAGLWTDYGYDIGGLTYTLDDLEHGLLRCNRPHPTKGNKLIAEGDSRWEDHKL